MIIELCSNDLILHVQTIMVKFRIHNKIKRLNSFEMCTFKTNSLVDPITNGRIGDGKEVELTIKERKMQNLKLSNCFFVIV